MKKIYCIIAVLLTAVVLMASCASSGGSSASSASSSKPVERKVPGSFPQFVKDAIINSPEDVLVGIGTAKLASQSQSLTVATTRARAEISRQMDTVIQDMIRDYTASSEVDPTAALAFQENITVALSKSRLTGSKVVEADYDANGACWVVVHLGKSSLVEEINQAQAAAKLAVPAAASFRAEEHMNNAFNGVNSQELRAGDR